MRWATCFAVVVVALGQLGVGADEVAWFDSRENEGVGFNARITDIPGSDEIITTVVPEFDPGVITTDVPGFDPGIITMTGGPGLDPRLVESLDPVSTPTAVYDEVIKVLKEMKGSKEWLPCAADIFTVLKSVKDFDMWALKMLDSGTKLPSGLLAGNIVDLGQYDECLSASGGGVSPQHCLISFTFHLPKQSKGSQGVLSMLGGSLTLTMAQCFPASCKPATLATAFGYIAEGMTFLTSSLNVTVTADVPDTDCHTNDSKGALDAADIAILFVLILLALIASAATVIDYLLISKNTQNRRPSPGELSVQAFSMYTNGKKLFSMKKNKEQMNCISGIKFLSIGWVVLGHRYRYMVTIPLVNLLTIPDMIQTWGKMFILNAILSVDTFFLISGLLNAYGFCTMRDRSRRYGILNILHSYVHRFIRLSPSYLLMIGMTATWIYRVGDGPIWDRMVRPARDACRENWWLNILYVNNYINVDNYCMMQSWYLAADMQMYLLSPFVIYPVWRWPIFGYMLLAVLTGVSVATPFCIAYFYDITTPVPVTTDPVEEAKEMDMLYFPTHTKTVSYVVGIFVGYLLYRIRVKKDMKLPLNIFSALLGWFIALACLLYAILGGHWLFLSSHPYTLVESSLYIGFYRLFWSIGVGWVILACVSGYGGIVNSFLSLEIFGPLGRLSYSIYLTHVFIILYKMASTRTAVYFSDYDVWQESMGEMVIILFFASLVSLVSESPILTLEKLLLGGGGGGRRKQNNDRVNSKAPSAPPEVSAQPPTLFQNRTRDPMADPGPRIRPELRLNIPSPPINQSSSFANFNDSGHSNKAFTGEGTDL